MSEPPPGQGRFAGLGRLDQARRGTVASFDERRGLGVVEEPDGSRWPFHCVAIAGGSRRIDEGASVGFVLTPSRRGELEARAVATCATRPPAT